MSEPDPEPTRSPTPPPPENETPPIPILLQLISHAHLPPLHPPANLKYDLRSIANPPKPLRDTHTGLSKRLREHLLHHTDFVSLLDRAEAEILAAAVAGAVERGKEGVVSEQEKEGVVSEREEEGGGGGSRVLSVAAFCARGHHRSVAFVEELAGRGWPRGWEVEVVHRDLESHGRSRGGKQRRGGRQGKQAGGFGLVLGGEE